MRVSIGLLPYFPALLLASKISPLTQAPTSTPSLETSSIIQPSNTALAIIQTLRPEASSIQNTDYHTSSIDGPREEAELRKRQNTGQVAGAAATSAATVATQQSPVTTYLAYGSGGVQTPVVFTQLFSVVPDQWDGPTVGSIGLGTITGKVGVVKTKRNLVAEATEAVKAGIERRVEPKKKEEEEVVLQRRANEAVTMGVLDMRQIVVTVGALILATWVI